MKLIGRPEECKTTTEARGYCFAGLFMTAVWITSVCPLGSIRALVGRTATAMSALSVGSDDGDGKELVYLQDALSLIHTLLHRDISEEFELVAVENTPSPSWKI